MKYFIVFLLLLSFVFTVFSQQVTVDLKDLDNVTRNKIIEKKKEEAGISNPEQIKEWAGVGKELGSAVKEMCHTLNVEVNE
jgi:hypothetical protein